MMYLPRLAFYRRRAGLSQQALARELDVNQAAVSNWERGVNAPAKKYRRKLCALLRATEEELFREEDICLTQNQDLSRS